MKEKFQSAMQKFARAILQPMLFLSVTGLLLALTVVFQLEQMPAGLRTVGTFIYDVFYNSTLNQLSVICCVGLVAAMAKSKKTDAALCGLTSFIMYLYANNSFLSLTGRLSETTGGTSGQAMVLGIQVNDMGVFLGIILGCVIAWVFNKFCDVKFPDALSIYGGSRFAFLICSIVSIVLAIVMSYVWPFINSGINALTSVISTTGAFGVFIYGFLNRFLIPIGMHHLVYMPFLVSPIGGSLAVGGQVIAEGAMPIWYAQLGMLSSITALDESAKYLCFGFSKMWGCVGIALAFIKTAKPEKKASTKAMLIPSLLVAVLAGITEPFEFVFLFAAPVLWLIHSVFDGLFQMLCYLFGVRIFGLGGFISTLTSSLIVPNSLTHIVAFFILGIIAVPLWYFTFVFFIKKLDLKTPGREDGDEIEFGKVRTREEAKALAEAEHSAKVEGTIGKNGIGDVSFIIEGLGGPENILEADCCITRLRCNLKDASLVNDEIINKFPNRGIVKKQNTVQIIIGMQVQSVREEVAGILKLDE